MSGKINKVYKVSDDCFFWIFPNNMGIKRKAGVNRRYEYSPKFPCEGHTWCFQIFQSYKMIRFCLCRCDSSPSVHNYTLQIKYVNSRNNWTSSLLTQEFSADECWGDNQRVYEFELLKDASGMAPIDFLRLQVTFNEIRGQIQPQPEASNSKKVRFQTPPDVEHENSLGEEQPTSSPFDSGDVDELLLDFEDLLLSGRNTDVTFKVKRRYFNAHKVILMARAPGFTSMFEHDKVEDCTRCVEIGNCDPESFDAFLRYLYTGKIKNLSVNMALDIYYISYKYGVNLLQDKCVNFMADNFCVEYFCEIVALALAKSEPELLESAKTFLSKNMKQIIASSDWKSFIVQYPTEANELVYKALHE